MTCAHAVAAVLAFGWVTLNEAVPRRPVEIVVAVETRGEDPVLDLTREDFVVQVDGEPAPVENLALMPSVAVILMTDQSPSMAGLAAIHAPSRSDPLQKAILGDFLSSLRAGDDLRLGKITSSISLTGPMPLTRSGIESFLEFLAATKEAFGSYFGSPIWDGVDQAVIALAGSKNSSARRLVILMTDGRAIGNRVSVEEAAERAVRSNVAVAIVAEGQPEQVRQDGGRVAVVRPDRALRWLAETTGGMYLADATTFGLGRDRMYPGRLFARAVSGQRSAYKLQLTVPDNDRPKILRVSVRRTDVVVRAPAMTQ